MFSKVRSAAGRAFQDISEALEEESGASEPEPEEGYVEPPPHLRSKHVATIHGLVSAGVGEQRNGRKEEPADYGHSSAEVHQSGHRLQTVELKGRADPLSRKEERGLSVVQNRDVHGNGGGPTRSSSGFVNLGPLPSADVQNESPQLQTSSNVGIKHDRSPSLSGIDELRSQDNKTEKSSDLDERRFSGSKSGGVHSVDPRIKELLDAVEAEAAEHKKELHLFETEIQQLKDSLREEQEKRKELETAKEEERNKLENDIEVLRRENIDLEAEKERLSVSVERLIADKARVALERDAQDVCDAGVVRGLLAPLAREGGTDNPEFVRQSLQVLFGYMQLDAPLSRHPSKVEELGSAFVQFLDEELGEEEKDNPRADSKEEED